MTHGKTLDDPTTGAGELALVEPERSGETASLFQYGAGDPLDGRAPDKLAIRRPNASAPPAGRIAYLEAIRGLASFQVLLLHAFSAFAPAIVFNHTPGGILGLFHFSPLFFAYDGYSAVYLFFALSGFVLTPLFDRFAGKPFALASSRWVRLAAPALAAAIVAVAVKFAVGAAPAEAGRAVGSGWLSSAWRPPAGAGYFIYDALVQAPITGYSQTSLLADRGLPIPFHSLQDAYIAPFWTLSVELQGSLLIMALIIVARRDQRLWGPLLFVAGAFFIRTEFICFLVGHALAKWSAQPSLQRMPAPMLAGLAALGISFCVVQEFGFVALMTSCWAQGLDWLPCSSNSLKMIGAMLVFVAALGSPGLEKILDRRPFVALGRLSFSLYLIHWPIVLGVGSVLFLAVGRGEDGILARGIAVVGAIGLSLVCAAIFSPADAWAIAASRRLRGAAGANVAWR